MSKPRELCIRCEAVTPFVVKHHASGIEFLCAVCGNQVDFLHDEEPDIDEAAEWEDLHGGDNPVEPMEDWE